MLVIKIYIHLNKKTIKQNKGKTKKMIIRSQLHKSGSYQILCASRLTMIDWNKFSSFGRFNIHYWITRCQTRCISPTPSFFLFPWIYLSHIEIRADILNINIGYVVYIPKFGTGSNFSRILLIFFSFISIANRFLAASLTYAFAVFRFLS